MTRLGMSCEQEYTHIAISISHKEPHLGIVETGRPITRNHIVDVSHPVEARAIERAQVSLLDDVDQTVKLRGMVRLECQSFWLF